MTARLERTHSTALQIEQNVIETNKKSVATINYETTTTEPLKTY